MDEMPAQGVFGYHFADSMRFMRQSTQFLRLGDCELLSEDSLDIPINTPDIVRGGFP
jgi:hypothetical protein